MNELKGMGVAMVTPMNEEGKVDYNGLQKLVKHLHGGADFLVVMGTTGEAVTLSHEEQMSVLDFVLEINAGKLPVVFGIGGNDTAAVAKAMVDFDRKGVVAFLSASPSYNKPTQEGIFHHYKAINDASNLPIILYNVPGRTASNVLPATVKRIADACDKIIGIKEAAGDIEQVLELKRVLPNDFLLLSGDDILVLPHMACGGHGVISVIGNAYPKEYAKMVALAAKGEIEEARAIQLRFMPIIRNIFAEGNPGGIKEVLRLLDICEPHMRLPLYPVSETLSKKLYQDVAELS